MTYKLYDLNGNFLRELKTVFYIHDGIVESFDGTKEWWVKGKRHRLDGPAIEWANGAKEWYVNGHQHRIGGPAYEWLHGGKYFYIDGHMVKKEEHDLLFSMMKLKGLI